MEPQSVLKKSPNMRITISNENNVPIITKDQDRNFGSSPKRTDTNSTNSQPQTPYLLKIGQGQNISAISPLLQSDPSSPMNYNLLAELGSSNSVHRNMSVPFEEDQIFINEQFGHEGQEVNNINRIPQLLTDSKNELDIKDPNELKSPDAKTDISFSLRTDYSAEGGENNENTKQSVFKRNRKSKGLSKVTFDDSLNTDILYDPNISSIHATRIEANKAKPKKTEFISVYSNRPIYIEKDEDSEPEESSEEKEQSPTVNYRPDRLRNDNPSAERQTKSFYYGMSDLSSINKEARWSKLKEDQAAKLYVKRKNNIFQGLKKLNKAKVFQSAVKSTPHQTFPKAKRLLETKSELLKPVSFSENEEISQSKIKSFYVENPEKKRSPNNQNSKRKSATPQKSQRSTHENIPKKSEQIKTVNVNLKLRSRSLSYEDIQPPLESTGLRSTTNKTIQIFEKKNKTEKNDKKIDEIYQLAREDVQKRIASIDKRLDENIKQKPNEAKESLHSVRKNSVEKPETQAIIVNEVNKVLEGPQKQGQQASEQQKEKQDTKRSDSGRKKQDENAMRELKMLINKGIPMKIDMQPTKLTPKNVSYNAGLEKEKVSFKTNLSKIERTSSSHKDFHTGESSSKRSQQQVIQCPDSPKQINGKRTENENKQSGSKTVTPKKIGLTPAKFSDLEALVSEKNKYSHIHYEKDRKTLRSPKSHDNRGETLDHSIENFRRLENIFKAYTAKESGRRHLDSTTTIKSKEGRLKDSDNSRLNSKRDDSSEAKQFTIRPQPCEKTISKKITPTASPTKNYERGSKGAFCKTPQPRSPIKEAKLVFQAPSVDYYGNNQTQETKMPRSQSDQRIRILGNAKSPKNLRDTNENKIQLQNILNDISLTGNRSMKNNNSHWTPINKYGGTPRHEESKSWISPLARKNSAKTIQNEHEKQLPQKINYLKGLFNAQKKKINNEKKAVQKRSEAQKDKLINVTSSEDLEDTLR